MKVYEDRNARGHEQKDTIWPTQVVMIAKRERTVPTKLSWRSVIEAMPTPTSKRKRESLILELQQKSK